MLSIDFSGISAVYAAKSGIERIYVGTDIAWTESEPMRFVAELSGGEIEAFDLQDPGQVDPEYELDPFSVTWNQTTYSDMFAKRFGRRISAYTPIVALRDNQSTGEFGISSLYSAAYLPELRQAVFPKAKVAFSKCFFSCRKLSSLSLPSLELVGSQAFLACESLLSVDFPKVKEIGEYAFTQCSSLTAASFASIESIPHSLFYENMYSPRSRIAEVYAPNVVSVGVAAFERCGDLSVLYAPALESIDVNAFSRCASLSSIDMNYVRYVGRSGFDASGLRTAIMPRCEQIDQAAFRYCDYLSAVYAPNVRDIGNAAFYMCPVSSLDIRGAETVGVSAFTGAKLDNVRFDRLQSLSDGALRGSGARFITLYNEQSDGIPQIPKSALDNDCIVYVQDEAVYKAVCMSEGLSSSCHRVILLSCIGLELECELDIGQGPFRLRLTRDKTGRALLATDDSGTKLKEPFDSIYDFESGYAIPVHAENYIGVAEAGAGVSAICDGCFENFSSLEYAFLPDCLSVGEMSFYQCSALTAVRLDQAEEIGAGAFAKCASLPSADFPACRRIGENAFYECRMLSSIGMERVLSVDVNALNRSGLKHVDLPAATYIAPTALNAMPALQSIRCASLESTRMLFDECPALTSLELPRLSSFDPVISMNMAKLKRLELPAMSKFKNPIAIARPSALSALNLASVAKSQFDDGVSAYVAAGFEPGCSLTCSDGIYVI